MKLHNQRDWLRELIHIRFPNTIKLILDANGTGEGLPSLLMERWKYTNEKTHEVVEYPPLIFEDDEETMEIIEDAMPILKGIKASDDFNRKYYPYMKACFENKSIQLLVSSALKDADYKAGKLTPEEFAQYQEHDGLQAELSNLKQAYTEKNVLIYERIVKSKKRDRATSLMYGLSMICDMEMENKTNLSSNRRTQNHTKLTNLARKPNLYKRTGSY